MTGLRPQIIAEMAEHKRYIESMPYEMLAALLGIKIHEIPHLMITSLDKRAKNNRQNSIVVKSEDAEKYIRQLASLVLAEQYRGES